VDVEERRAARIGTVGGLALLTGGTAVAAVSGGTHSIFATVTLALLALGMGHALLDEVRRQAARGAAGGWGARDTANTVLLGSWAVAALLTTILYPGSVRLRAVGAGLSIGYAVICGYFVWSRRRAVLAAHPRAKDRAAA
jgi:hypothetical protein